MILEINNAKDDTWKIILTRRWISHMKLPKLGGEKNRTSHLNSIYEDAFDGIVTSGTL